MFRPFASFQNMSDSNSDASATSDEELATRAGASVDGAPVPVSAWHWHPLSQRIAMNQLTTFRWSLQEDLDAYREYGIPAIGVSWKKLREAGIQNGIRRIQRSGMTVSNLSWIGGFTGQYGHGLKEAINEAKTAIRIAGHLRAESVTVITGSQNRHIDSHLARLVTDALRELGDLAAIYDIQLAIQPMHPIYARDWTFLQSLEETLHLLDRVRHPAVSLALGTFHLIDDPDIFKSIKEIVDRIAIVTLSDRDTHPRNQNDQKLPGEGNLPIRELVTSLEFYGYVGWYQTEVWSRDLWKMDHVDLIGRCQRAQTKYLP